MKLLALDTSSVACTAGVLAGGKRHTRYVEQPREHTRLLMPMIREVLADASIGTSELDAIVLGNGPGSFIGLRIAASVAQGIAHGAGIDVVPVSSLAAVAMAAGRPGDVVAVAQDAHMTEVYLGIYRVGEDGLPVEVLPERIHDLSEMTLPRDVPEVITAGAGWELYPALAEANAARTRSHSDQRYPAAGELLVLGEAGFRAGMTVRPEAVDPAYLRKQVASPPAESAS